MRATQSKPPTSSPRGAGWPGSRLPGVGATALQSPEGIPSHENEKGDEAGEADHQECPCHEPGALSKRARIEEQLEDGKGHPRGEDDEQGDEDALAHLPRHPEGVPLAYGSTPPPED